jgi:hypothetical protein
MPDEWDPLEAATRRFISDDLNQELSFTLAKLERRELHNLNRLPEEFWGNLRSRAERRFRRFATDLADGKVRRRVAHQVAKGFRLLMDRRQKSMEAHRVSEIAGLVQRHKIDQDRGATWIREGVSVDAVCALILDGIASKNKPISASDTEKPPAPRTEKQNGANPYEQELAGQAEILTAEFEDQFVSELQRIADEAILQAEIEPAKEREPARDRASETAVDASSSSAFATDGASAKDREALRDEKSPSQDVSQLELSTAARDGNPSDREENSRRDPTANWDPADWDRAKTITELYEELSRLPKLAVGRASEEELRKAHPELEIWSRIDVLEGPKREQFFRTLRSATAENFYTVTGSFFGLGFHRTKKLVELWRKHRST